jgi:hypothetical protein
MTAKSQLNEYAVLFEKTLVSSLKRYAREMREISLDPNVGSILKVCRYSCGLKAQFTLGIARAFPIQKERKDWTENELRKGHVDDNASIEPGVRIRPQEMRTNTPEPDMIWLQSVRCANVSPQIGLDEDSFLYRTPALIDWPTMSPKNMFYMNGTYNGRIPVKYTADESFTFSLVLIGPAEITTNYPAEVNHGC